MPAIDMLIKIKKQANTDDLIILMDEVVLYEKLSKVEAFRDLKTSKTAAKKLPLLSAAHKGDIYCMTMLELVREIITYMTGTAPPITIVQEKTELTAREEKMKKVMERSIVQVRYHNLEEYRHDTMKDFVVAVFSETVDTKKSILIVVRKDNYYNIYQGHYSEREDEVGAVTEKPYVYIDDPYVLSIKTYSILGNNAYPFAVFNSPSGTYSVMFPRHDEIWLTSEDGQQTSIYLSEEEITEIGMKKVTVHSFAKCLMDIIRERGENI